MICLRPRGFSTPFGSFGSTCALMAALLATAGSLTPGALAATATSTPHSRTHRISSVATPLHYTEHSFAVPHGKSGSKHAAAAASGAKAKRGSAKALPARKHGHEQPSESEDAIPMHRAGHAFGHGTSQPAHLSLRQQARQGNWRPVPRTASRYGRRVPLPAPDPVVAEVTGRSSHGDYLATLHSRATQSHYVSPHSRDSVVVASARSQPAWHGGGATAAGGSYVARDATPTPIQRQPSPYGTQAAYATGIANPPDDRYRMAAPYNQPSGQGTQPATPGNPLSAVTATVQATSPLSRSVANTQVVGGFGSELALAPAQPGDSPAATRRRNHPLAASALPEDARSTAPATMAASLPNTLSERDAITAAALAPAILPDTYDRDGRLAMPAPLKGSREVLIHQNTMADNDGLERINNNAELDRLRATHELVDLPASDSLRVNGDLPYNRRSARPWTALFTQDIARDYYARFHQPLWVTSAVRTVAFQSHLLRVNGNAAGLYGDFASPHLTGQAVDFGKRGMTAAQLAWMRSYLLPLIQSGKIDVEEEFQQACFHISVYRRYAGGRHIVNEVAKVSTQPASQYTPVRPVAVLPDDVNDQNQ